MNTQAQLFIGPHTQTVNHAQTVLQKRFCKDDGCTTCSTCKQLTERQHHGVIWLAPEKQYTRDQLEPIFKTISFALEPGQHLFFVVQKADFLTAACANSLLKSVEEPPPGYHFIFLAEREQQVLPTIRSRCTIHSLYGKKTAEDEQFLNIFKKKVFCAPAAFDKLLWQKKPNERETVELLDVLLAYWIEENKKNIEKKENKAPQMIALLTSALENPPMPGSSKLFWRNFYLQMSQIILL